MCWRIRGGPSDVLQDFMHNASILSRPAHLSHSLAKGRGQGIHSYRRVHMWARS